MDNKADILILGAGATGLMAARELAKAGKKVIVLEARNRIGGRIHIINDASFFKQAELGAEFVHGDLPITLNLLKEAGIGYRPARGEMWWYDKGKFSRSEQSGAQWGQLMESLDQLEKDMSMANFLNQYFPGDQYAALRTSVSRYVSGYDTADMDKVSAFSLRKEWQSEDENAQHRVDGGYCTMINYLANEYKNHNGQVSLNTIAKQIGWDEGQVTVTTANGMVYYAEKLLIALPLGVLQANEDEQGAITFYPPIPAHQQAIQKLGFGAIIKILLEFDEPFWEDVITEDKTTLKDLLFLLGAEEIPTWWTQAPEHSPILTGWLGGMPAEEKKDITDEELLALSLQSLSNIFKIGVIELKDKLIAWQVANWAADPFTRGSYAYDTLASPAARRVLSTPVSDNIYFAGEYLYDGAAMGTVEAALTSGLEAARGMIG